MIRRIDGNKYMERLKKFLSYLACIGLAISLGGCTMFGNNQYFDTEAKEAVSRVFEKNIKKTLLGMEKSN